MDLHRLLKQHWGYTEFRAKQESIVRNILDGRDVAVIMPTGGGKSLCYQLPAIAMDRTCIVVSPLIALMQDQAAQLQQAGVAAAFLNSSLDPASQREIMRGAQSGAFRLLYLSPERLVRGDVLDWLKRVPVGFFAIDEAHCISEWGHEFRPEYRQLRALREWFPETPIAAFTASATSAVRHDIVAQLRLRDPAKFVMSFHRPNLRYIARECGPREQEPLLYAALDYYDEGNVIIYAPTVKGVEETAALLSHRGLPVVPYHGQMTNPARQKNQEAWMAGDKRILVGTIAFGLGINKPDVRAVLHLSLPKSLEQYYQEAGRAGRDGLEADCILLWQKRDAGLLAHFIQQLQDPGERERSWQRYHAMRRFVEADQCRHRQICLHFGETPKWERCDACDRCGVELDWLAARAETPEPAVAAPRRKAAKPRVIEGDIDSKAREALREWRRAMAKEMGMPPYVVMHDSTLDAICRRSPSNIEQLCEVPGIGEKRAERFGAAILKVLKSLR
ncbi:MAG: RecQ family ATP-dependent DNA helicase [Acidobacteriia bacterium]|nr:RecQ family ATP-dependent DNA helicase [Terriglobia bacterium]